MKSIFVSIASFCDENLLFTLNSLINNSSSPENIFIGIVDQSFDGIRGAIEENFHSKNIRYLQVNPIHSKGVCWARNLAMSLFDGEDYYLQIDSHTLFDPKWDVTLLNHIERLKRVSAKPILSTYPPGFEFDESGTPFKTNRETGNIYALEVHPESMLTEEDLTLRFRVTHVGEGVYCHGFHLAGGFIFCEGGFVNEIPYDPNLYFHGEEQSLAIRAYTSGWDIFHPRQVDIPICHLYKARNTKHDGHHWREDIEKERRIKWIERKNKAKIRLRELLSDMCFESPYGLGDIRSLDEFKKISGIDYTRYNFNRVDYKIITEEDLSEQDGVRKIGIFIPTHGRPDFLRGALLQIASQSLLPNVVAIHQNGEPESYRFIIEDLKLPFDLIWIHTKEKVHQHKWYAIPLMRLIDMGCTVYLWMDHDDIYASNHIEQCCKDLQHSEFRISDYSNLLYVDNAKYIFKGNHRFKAHAPGGMSSSMAFKRNFAKELLKDLKNDKVYYYSDNVVAYITMPKFSVLRSEVVTTTYVSHRGSQSSASWIDKVFESTNKLQ